MACNILPQQISRRFGRADPSAQVCARWQCPDFRLITRQPPDAHRAYRIRHCGSKRNAFMRKTLPETMFRDAEQSRLTMLRSWVLDYEVTEIQMNERQFWNFANLQPVAEKPWVTFMGRVICVPDMPIDAQKHLGIFDKRSPGAI
jgi:hypothetical protein